jgi:CTP synthase
MQKKTKKYIFVVGGVMSSVGKGVAAGSIGRILQARGLKVTAIKIDPYVNVDAGTMNPTEHGEVFVLDDGMECDQDMGNYERFMGANLDRDNYMTTGSIYLEVIRKERNLEYGGRCVHVVPDIPLEVISRIKNAVKKTQSDIVLIEIGGTIGDYQNVLFLEAVRMLKFTNPNDVLLALVSFVPSIGGGGNELKTKPTQHAVRFLNGCGLHPDLVLARAPVIIDDKRKEKLEFMCGLAKGSVVSAPDVKSIYDIPINFEDEGLTDWLLKKLNLRPKQHDLKEWRQMALKINNATKVVRIGVVGKYFSTGDFVLEDSYISVLEAIKHAGGFLNAKPEIEWLDSSKYEGDLSTLKELDKFNGIIVPGGFGSRGIEGKIRVAKYCRIHKIPYFGLCYGMQIAIIEFARNILKIKDAHTTEIDHNALNPVIDIMPEQKKNLKDKNYGATMRLGAYPADLKEGSIAYNAYKVAKISERHRHRYEVNPDYIERLEKAGLVFSGISPDKKLMEIVELPKNRHPFYLGTQFHPELKSQPLHPHPLFTAFIKSCIGKKTK